jgi:hypothetical protein
VLLGSHIAFLMYEASPYCSRPRSTLICCTTPPVFHEQVPHLNFSFRIPTFGIFR